MSEQEQRRGKSHIEKSSWLRLLTRAGGLFRGGPRELLTATERRVPFLDALRCIAVLLVVNAHVTGQMAKAYGENLYMRFPLTKQGWIGVDLFFVLSGYFIGTQLWRELQASGTISYRRFVVRRGLRIWPLYYFMFAVMFIFVPGFAASKQYGWSDLVFLTNYSSHGIVLGSWSLCTEEQFYLLTPLLLLLIGRRSMQAYRWGLAAVLALVCVVRELTYLHWTGDWMGRHPVAFSGLYFPFHTHCDGLITGLFVANLVASKAKVRGLLARPGLLVILSFLFVCGIVTIHAETMDFLGVAVFFASLVWWGIQSRTRLFHHHIFYLISRLSFGMYLNHEYMARWIPTQILPALGLLRFGPFVASFAGFIVLSLMSMAIATVTFCLVEHPFLMIRTALLSRNSVSPLVAH